MIQKEVMVDLAAQAIDVRQAKINLCEACEGHDFCERIDCKYLRDIDKAASVASAKIIAVDFDGTLCENRYPEIGSPNLDLIETLKRRRADGDKIILWSCREGDLLEKAISWCYEKGLEFDSINESLTDQILAWGNNCRKVGADIYIDDKAVTPEEFLNKE